MQSARKPNELLKSEERSFVNRPLINHNVRFDENRVILADRSETKRSIFSIGDVRHNVPSKQDLEGIAKYYRNLSN